MAAKTKEGTSPGKRGRTKVGNIPKKAQDMPSKQQKRIKGGAADLNGDYGDVNKDGKADIITGVRPRLR